MIIWKDILEQQLTYVDHTISIKEGIELFNKKKTAVIFVQKNNSFIGYSTVQMVLNRLSKVENLNAPLPYETNILKVSQHAPVEFFHNVEVVVGIGEKGEVVGYQTMSQAMEKINELEFQHLNLTLDGAGIGIVRTDSQFKIEYMNKGAEVILGIHRNFLQFRNYKTLLTIDKDLDLVCKGETFINIDGMINFKEIIGSFYPLKIDGEIKGIVHIFFLKKVFEQSVQELDFVRNLHSDLQALLASSQEQILVMDGQGKIVRLAGVFLEEFWKEKNKDSVLGKNIIEFVRKGIFEPNIFEICKTQKRKITAIQESKGNKRFWSVATPVYHEGKLEKVIVLSREMNQQSQLPENKGNKSSELPEVNGNGGKKQLVYRSNTMKKLISAIERVAKFNSTILLEGESGTGKEMFANLIHDLSPRKDEKLVRINCGAIPENLIESELFGYERGAFTGADKKGKQGIFEVADHGTLFLDEIGELPLKMQVKLLRVIQEKEVTRIGGHQPIPVNVRIVCATNRDLKEMVNRGEFREDLYYRLNVVPFRIPPLRERKEDILPFAMNFLKQFHDQYGIKKSFAPEAIEIFESYDWPGNVRELQNIVERLVLLSEDEYITKEDVISSLYREESNSKRHLYVLDLIPMKEAIEELEIQLIKKGMKQYRTAAQLSKVLGVSPATISRRMKKMQIDSV